MARGWDGSRVGWLEGGMAWREGRPGREGSRGFFQRMALLARTPPRRAGRPARRVGGLLWLESGSGVFIGSRFRPALVLTARESGSSGRRVRLETSSGTRGHLEVLSRGSRIQVSAGTRCLWFRLKVGVEG